MGSEGEKHSRRRGRREHLPKVGTRDELLEEQRLERRAVGDVMGLHRSPTFWRWFGVLIAVIVVVALVVARSAL